MQYRELRKTGFDISILTAGIFQLDFVSGTLPRDSFGASLDAVREAVDCGVNAINLGFPFYLPDMGAYAREAGRLLADVGGRAKTFMNIPVTATAAKSVDDLDGLFERQMAWFGLERADYVLIEDIERFGWVRFVRMGGLEWVQRKAAEGRIGAFGFDFRDDCFFLKEIFEAYPWAVAQFRLSFMDKALHPGTSGIKYVTDAGAGLVVTEPFKSRRLLAGLPDGARSLYDGARTQRDPDEWALLWAWNEPAVSSVVVSMDGIGEAQRYLGIADSQAPLTMLDQITVNKVYDVYRKRRIFSCTECRCCMPCPIGIDSPGIGALYNDYMMYGDSRVPAFLYGVRGFGETPCVGCGVCAKHCPRDYAIMDAVKAAQAFFPDAAK